MFGWEFFKEIPGYSKTWFIYLKDRVIFKVISNDNRVNTFEMHETEVCPADLAEIKEKRIEHIKRRR
jgi:hypothetical protein